MVGEVRLHVGRVEVAVAVDIETGGAEPEGEEENKIVACVCAPANLS
eukprot:CAMPEP_0203988482 /NCGR_PEP_ID=MMETSP0360-20130528/7430_1 /ASSEMBLY_ACC=CAM_ASM_000342 /TAXON_ID=268821 /ORGANISM="Scrippsiella Hangoei, Strain SHTV-5" /LENGTH=46 /DNA_ID= /DNA_START= /DNA_END= /DNA_ORIENTATION=